MPAWFSAWRVQSTTLYFRKTIQKKIQTYFLPSYSWHSGKAKNCWWKWHISAIKLIFFFQTTWLTRPTNVSIKSFFALGGLFKNKITISWSRSLEMPKASKKLEIKTDLDLQTHSPPKVQAWIVLVFLTHFYLHIPFYPYLSAWLPPLSC